jgi:hypothetical protein
LTEGHPVATMASLLDPPLVRRHKRAAPRAAQFFKVWMTSAGPSASNGCSVGCIHSNDLREKYPDWCNLRGGVALEFYQLQHGKIAVGRDRQMEQLQCPRCGNQLVKVCENCGTVIPAEGNQEGWRPDISRWSRQKLVLFWLVCVVVMYFLVSASSEYIGGGLPTYIALLFGIPYALTAVTRKWLSSRH